MPAYVYDAVTAAGRRRRGRGEADDRATLLSALERRGLVVVRIDEDDRVSRAGAIRRLLARAPVLEATRALAALLEAGLPLARALDAASYVVSGRVADTLRAVRTRVEQGATLATALGEHPSVFPPLYVGLVRAGERGGDLAGAFGRLVEHLERETEFRARLLSASIYPTLLAGVGGVAVIVLLLFVLPRFAELLQGAGATLPRSTAFLLGVTHALRRWGPIAIPILAAGAAAAAWYAATRRGRRLVARLLLRTPGLGHLRRQALAARFARVTSVLLTGGAPVLSALTDAGESLTDPVAKAEVDRIRSEVRAGGSLHAALGSGSLFPELLGRLAAVGERSGTLARFLAKAAEIFEAKAARTVTRLVALAEPAMIIVFGAIVAMVALALLQAVYGVNAGAFR